jgi:hypothetical protein
LDKSSHESTPRPTPDKDVKRRVPRFIFAVILLGLAGLYWFAAYGDTPAPEKVVKNFYHAYFNRDFNTVAQNLSVFWSVRFLPDYASQTPAELLANRSKVEKDIASVITDIEKDNEIPTDVTIEIMKDYTKIGKESAIVVYNFIEGGKKTSMEASILILENGQFRIFNMSPVDDSVLDQIKSLDINILDQNFTDLLAAPNPVSDPNE